MPNPRQSSLPVARAFMLTCVALCAACRAESPAEPAATDAEPTSFLPTPEVKNSDCGEHGSFDAELFGVIETSLRWRGEYLECLNMPRPNDEGVRLRFSGMVGDERIAVIVALPDYQPGESAAELPSNITLSVEGSGRFFSTSDLQVCFTDIDAGEHGIVTGTVYCVAPLGELNGDGSVTLAEMRFSTAVRDTRS